MELGTTMAWEPLQLNYSHEALIDQIMANPAASNAQLGAVFGRSAQWVSLVRSSGIFREAYNQRAKAVMDPVLMASVEERLEMVTQLSLEKLADKLNKPAADIPDNLVLAAAALGAKGMGVGGFTTKPAAPPPAPKEGRIERLAERLLNLGRPQGVGSGEVLDLPFVDVVPTA